MKQRVIYGTLFALITVGMIVLCQPTRVIFFVTCALIAAHEMRKALEKADLAFVPVISVNLSGLEKNPGFSLTLPLIRWRGR